MLRSPMGRRRRSRWELCSEDKDPEGGPQSETTPLPYVSNDNATTQSPPRKRRCRWEYQVGHESGAQPPLNTTGYQNSREQTCAPIGIENMLPVIICSAEEEASNQQYIDHNDEECDDCELPALPTTMKAPSASNHFAQLPFQDDLSSSFQSSSVIPSENWSRGSVGEVENEHTEVGEPLSKYAFEFKRLGAFLYTSELASVSHRTVEKLISIPPINTSVSYRTMVAFAQRTSLTEKWFARMCPEGHCTARGRLRHAKQCPVCGKAIEGRGSSKFWYMKPSSAIKALCRAKDSFLELKNGWHRIRSSQSHSVSESREEYHDFHHGRMFRRMYSRYVKDDEVDDNDIVVFLTFSTDGFECMRNRRGEAVSSWPLVSTILNYSPKERARANNALVFAIVPGSHSPDYFDTFLQALIEDFQSLEKGISVLCHDNKIRTIRAYLTFFTADWPAASKVLGYVGHTGTIFCRFCLRRKQYVPEFKSSYVIPKIPKATMKALMHPRGKHSHQYRPGDITHIECTPQRKGKDIHSTWKSLRLGLGEGVDRRGITKATGIKKDCFLRKLTLDFKYSFPYDVMHLVLIGWTKQVAKLMCGFHKQHEKATHLPKYCIPSVVLDKIEREMERASSGIPVSWGRAPLPLSEIQKYKAEDLKRLAEMYFLPYLHRFSVSNNKIRLWWLTSRMVQISFQYRCDKDAVLDLQRVVEEAYARFVHEFFACPSESYCFTPSTHCILHLPDLLKECGPLPVTSQFLIERLLGDMGRRMTSKTNVNSHLFHKSHRLYTLRIMNDGIAPKISDEAKLILDDNEYDSETCNDSAVQHEEVRGIRFRGVGKAVELWNGITVTVTKFVRDNFPQYTSSYHIRTIKQFRSALVSTSTTNFTVETQKCFQDRCRLRTDARQKFCVAAEFERLDECNDECAASQVPQSNGSTRSWVDMYYGDIQNLYEVQVVLVHESGNRVVHAGFFEIRWYYGCAYDEYLDLVYTKDRRRSETTIEPSNCVKRPTGFLEIAKRRYFLDKQRRQHVLGPRRVQLPFAEFTT